MKRTHWIWMVMAYLCLIGSTTLSAAPLTGTVTDTDGFSLLRVAGATISLSTGQVTVTDGDGDFGFADVVAGTHTLTVSHPDYNNYTMDLVMPDVPKNIVLSLEGFRLVTPGEYTFRVIVTTPDGMSNTPVPGAEVVIMPGNYMGTAGADGIVDFVLPGGMYNVNTSAVGYTSYDMDLTLDTNKQVVHSLEEIVDESPAPITYALTGIVTDPDGTSNTGIPGVVLTLSPGGYSTTTDSDGRFAFPALPEGTYTLNLNKPGYSAPDMDLRMDGNKHVVLSMYAGDVE